MAKRRLAAGLICAAALLGNAQAQPPAPAGPPPAAIIGTPPQPLWGELNPTQQDILAPLARDWDAMEGFRRKQWLGIAERYPNMKPAEQRRIQARMQEWGRMTPEQRARVRDSYRDFNQLPSEQKQAIKEKWKAYLNLPPEERRRLREAGKSAQLLAPQGEAEETAPRPAESPSTEDEAPRE